MAYELRGSEDVGKIDALRSRLRLLGSSTLFRRRRGQPTESVAGTVGAMTRHCRPLTSSDVVAVAHNMLRKSMSGSLCLLFDGRIVGMISLISLDRALGHSAWSGTARIASEPLSALLAGPEAILTVSDVPVLVEQDPISAARSLFEEMPEAAMIGVVDRRGYYEGVLLRSDLVSADLGNLAPSRVGGMATPLGVYLTDGVVSGGAGSLGLFLTGLTMASLFLVAALISNFLLDQIERRTGFDITRTLALTFMGLSPGDIRSMAQDAQSLVAVPLMLAFVRLVPIAGFHAAEHQTVHAMERGEPLVPATVQRMPRAHPRCGTNLVAAVGVFSAAITVLFGYTDSIGESVIPAALITICTWRFVGTFLQNFLTTRPASPTQIASGIRAGRQVMERYIAGGIERYPNIAQRIWRMGLIQIMIGASSLVPILDLITLHWPKAARLVNSLGL